MRKRAAWPFERAAFVSLVALSLQAGAQEIKIPIPRDQQATPGGELPSTPLEADDTPVAESGAVLPVVPEPEPWRHSPANAILPKRVDVLALTISGAVSLGAYEAGQLYFLVEMLARSPGSARLLVATGASAGSANALVSATHACRGSTPPDSSLGYRVWVPVGLEQLFDPERATSRSLFVRDAMNTGFSVLSNEWKRGLPGDCDFVVGIAATREMGLDVQLAEGLIVPRQSERFVFRVRGRDGHVPVFSNYVEPNQSFERPLLPFSEGTDITGEGDFSAVREAVLASTAFPVAFAPQSVSHCLTNPDPEGKPPTKRPPTCARPTRRDAFLDGGVFDNSPLGSAHHVARDGLVTTKDGKVSFRDAPTGGHGDTPQVLYGFVDPDLTDYPLFTPPEQRAQKDDPLLDILTSLGGQMLSTTRGQQLAELAETTPNALRRLWLIQGNYPPISGLLGAFFGFFERDFRDFDFHLGTYDSFTELREMGSVLGAESGVAEVVDRFHGKPSDVPSSFRKLGCLLAHFEPREYAHLGSLCSGAELKNFRVLLQTTIDRLWSNCRQLPRESLARTSHAACRRAQKGEPYPVVDPSFHVEGSRGPTTSESDFDYTLRLLGDYGFHFRDLGLDASESQLGRRAVRRKLADMVEALADAQPDFADRAIVLTGGRAVVNSIEYEPPIFRGYALLGTSIAGGILHRAFDRHELYFNVDARLNNIRTLVTDRTDMFAATVSAGFEFSLLPLSGSVLQSSLGVRAGYQMSGNDSFGFERCSDQAGAADPRNCSQFVVHAPVNLTLLERVRFNLTPLFYPVPESFGHRPFDLELGIGALFF